MKKSIIQLGFVSIAALSFSTQAIAALPSDAVVDSLNCDSNTEDLMVTTGGIEDNYSGGIDPVNPAPDVIDSQAIIDYNTYNQGATLRAYDDGGNDRFFVERLSQTRIGLRQATKGLFIIKMRTTGGQYNTDSLTLGLLNRHGDLNQLGKPVMLRYQYGSWSTLAIPGGGWSQSGDMFVGDLSKLDTAEDAPQPRTMLDVVNMQRRLDIMVQDDSEIDFVKLALCVKKQ